MNIKLDDYDIDILVQGFPGRSVYHAGLGWGTIALLRGAGRVVLIDGGSISMRGMLIDKLAKHGFKPADVTDLLLTHAHHDHMINWTLFRHARIVIGAKELEWALNVPWGETSVPELYALELQKLPTLKTVNDGDEAFSGMTAHLAPGHTRGSVIFVLHGREHDVIFTGDAVKNRAEFVSGKTDQTYDAAVACATVSMAWDMWKRRPGSVVVPGHDLPMTLENGEPRYMGKREAAITAWYGDDLATKTMYDLTKK
jgi:glyoxylase-like metal-dependent hydrolase (beta-lactamase superfamily II)